MGIACGSIRGVVWCIWQNCIGTGYVFMLLFDTPFPGLKQHYNSVWRDSTPNWILDGFKFQASTGSVVSHG